MEHNPAYWIPIGIAVASLVVVPALVAVGKRLLDAWREAQHARLAKLFMPREEIEMQWDQLSKTQARQHAENRDFLETIRTEAHKREERLLEAIESGRTEVGTVHQRVDRLFELITGGRKK